MRWKILLHLLRVKSVDDELCDIIDYMVEENLTYRKRLGKIKDLNNNERLRLSALANKIRRKNFKTISQSFLPSFL